MAPTCQFCVGRSQKRNKGLCHHFCLAESFLSPALILMLDSSVFPHMFLVLFELLPQCWSSETLSPSKCVHSPFKKYCLRFQHSSPQPQSLLVFTSRSHGNFSSWHWNPGLQGLCGAGAPHSSGGPLQLRYISQFLSATHGCGTSLLCLHPSYQSHSNFFFKSPVVGLSFSYISSGSE